MTKENTDLTPAKNIYGTKKDAEYQQSIDSHLESLIAKGTKPSVLVNEFAKYASRQGITQFLARYEMYKLIQNVQSI